MVTGSASDSTSVVSPFSRAVSELISSNGELFKVSLIALMDRLFKRNCLNFQGSHRKVFMRKENPGLQHYDARRTCICEAV